MKPIRIIVAALCCILPFTKSIQAQEMDKELTDVATKLAALTKENGKKKIAVLDFTDIQGGSSELGKYVAEQLTVNMVMVKNNFSVLDRANLQKILAEHKLTATGLIDPENAKKLGQFAGVDALVLGTLTPKNSKISLTAKIITTDTAEIVGAAKTEFISDETTQKLASQAVLNEGTPALGTTPSKALASQDFSNVRVNIDKLRILQDGWVKLDISFQNKSANKVVAVALYQEICFDKPCSVRTTLTAANGQQFGCKDEDLQGIKAARFAPYSLTEIEPGGTIKASIQFSSALFNGSTTSFNLQSELMLNQNYNARDYANYQLDEKRLPPGCKVHNLVLDIPAP